MLSGLAGILESRRQQVDCRSNIIESSGCGTGEPFISKPKIENSSNGIFLEKSVSGLVGLLNEGIFFITQPG